MGGAGTYQDRRGTGNGVVPWVLTTQVHSPTFTLKVKFFQEGPNVPHTLPYHEYGLSRRHLILSVLLLPREWTVVVTPIPPGTGRTGGTTRPPPSSKGGVCSFDSESLVSRHGPESSPTPVDLVRRRRVGPEPRT